MKKRWYRGSITVFLTLIFVLFLSLICTVLESIRVEGAKVRSAACLDLGLFSLFGEYERDLFSEYHVLFLDGSYGTGNLSEEKMETRLKFFMNQNEDVRESGSKIDWFRVNNIETDIKEYFLATDEGGKPFMDQALLFMEGVEEKRQKKNVKKEAEDIRKKIQILNQKEKQLRAFWEESYLKEKKIFGYDPISWLDLQRDKEERNEVIPSSFLISKREISGFEKVRERSKNQGGMKIPERKGKEKNLFKNYLFFTFGNALEQKERKALLYELEYFLGGYKTDEQNINYIVKELLKIRWADNFFCLLQDTAKRKEANEMIQYRKKKMEKKENKNKRKKEKEIEKEKADERTEELILLIWAYRESLNDLKKLFEGEYISFQKNEEEWEIQNAEFWQEDKIEKKQNSGEGWNYEDYLWLLFEKNEQDNLPMKALDLIEWELKSREETKYFCADCCVGGIATEALWQIEPVFFRITSAFSGIRTQTIQHRTQGSFFYGMGE